MKLANYLAAILFCLAAPAALAHSDEYFDANPSPHGGQVRMAGPYHFELLVEQGTLTVYVTDHADAPIATAGASALAVVEAPKVKTQVKLAPAGGNMLKGQGEFANDPAMRVKLTVTMPGAKRETARFTPLKKTGAAKQ